MPRAQPKAAGSLAELIADPPPAEIVTLADAVAAVEIALHLIDENPENPRSDPTTQEDKDADAELTASIGKEGVLQPIMVRPNPADAARFLVIMGSRRLRCSKAAGKFTIPAVLRDVDAAKAFEIASIENLQRQDMNPIDEAKAFQRILDDRLAGDPTLKLKDAKQVIADATGKSVRFVELRLQLLTLEPVLQVEIREGRTTPKDAIIRQRQAPKLAKFTPRQWLTLAEVYDKSLREPQPTAYEWATPETLCRHEAIAAIAADAELQVIVGHPHYSLNTPGPVWKDGEKTGQTDVGVHSSTVLQLRLLAKDRLGLDDPDPADPKVRAGLLAALRSDVEIAGTLPAGAAKPGKLKAGEYVTPWLNGPFDPPADVLAEIAAERQRRADEKAERERAQLDRAAAQQEAADRRARDEGEPGQALLAQVLRLQFHAETGLLAVDEFRRLFAEILQGYDFAGPFTVEAGRSDDPRNVTIVAGDGGSLGGAGFALEAKRRLICLAMNFACGLPATSGPALPDPDPEDQSDDAVRLAGDPENTNDENDEDFDPFEDEPEDDDEDELEDARAEDDETPDFLLRLAGGRPKSEARA